MELRIEIDNTLDEYSGKISQQTYVNLFKKRKQIDYLNLGFDEQNYIRVDICDNNQLEQNVLYLSSHAKSLLYPDKEKLTFDDFVEIVNDLEKSRVRAANTSFDHSALVPPCEA